MERNKIVQYLKVTKVLKVMSVNSTDLIILQTPQLFSSSRKSLLFMEPKIYLLLVLLWLALTWANSAQFSPHNLFV
jgi:hypothetical protein